MSDLIRRKDVIREFVKSCSIEHVDINNVAIFYETIMKIINSIPSVEPEQTAKVEHQVTCWEDIRPYKEGMCASCGRNVYDHAKYCDECGAKLDWSDDE